MPLPDWFWRDPDAPEPVPTRETGELSPHPKWDGHFRPGTNKTKGFKPRWLGVPRETMRVSPYLNKAGEPAIIYADKKTKDRMSYRTYHMLVVWWPSDPTTPRGRVGWLKLPQTVIDRLRQSDQAEPFTNADFTIYRTGEGSQTRYTVGRTTNRLLSDDPEWQEENHKLRKHLVERGLVR